MYSMEEKVEIAYSLVFVVKVLVVFPYDGEKQ
jgi:hypothetical protein